MMDPILKLVRKRDCGYVFKNFKFFLLLKFNMVYMF